MSCPREGKWIGGCKFEPRYDEGPADLSAFRQIDQMTEAALDRFRPKTYVRDVCVTCGKTIERAG